MRLQDAKQSDWVIPECGEVNSSERIGFSVLFALPKTMESRPVHDDGMHSFFISPRGGETVSSDLIIVTSSEEITGAAESLGSERFEERWVKDGAGNVIGMDARGRMKYAGYWRSVDFLRHDTADYRLRLPREKPKAFDQIIDSACIAKR